MKFAWYVFRGFPLATAIVLIGLSAQMIACSTAALTRVSKTQVGISGASAVVDEQAKTLASTKTTVDGLTPQNVPVAKPLIQKGIADATSQNKAIKKDLTTASAGAKQDAAVIASASDPVKVRLEWFGYSAIVLGIVALVGGFFFATQLGSIAGYARSGGAASVVAGILVLFIATFLATLLHFLAWAVGLGIVVSLVVGGVWAYLHRYSLIPSLEALIGKTVTPALAAVKRDVA